MDPGLSRCGYACLSGRGAAARAVAAGVITTPPGQPVPQRLAMLQREIRGLLGELTPAVVALERVLFQVNVRTAMGVGQAAGVVMAEAVAAGCEVVEYSPNQVKLAVCGDGAAGKDQVARMVQMLLGLPEPLRPADTSDAAAVALCHLAQSPTVPPPATAGTAPLPAR
ncbi:MAG: crossover junction endodeoxyribonuclease RuvC [bacterium]|nr:crossover junction endodeoxyribonuclease RuvC [bacterium]